MSYIVLKFGGTSQCLSGVKVISKKIREYVESGHKVFIVISAVQKTTNDLYDIIKYDFTRYHNIYTVHQTYCKEIGVNFDDVKVLLDDLKQTIDDFEHKPVIDMTQPKLKIISYGEQIASLIVSKYLLNNGIDNKLLNAHHFMKNKSLSSSIDVQNLNIKGEFYCDKIILDRFMKSNNVFITQGFIASTIDEKFCILTRSGSNTSAALIASCLNASRLEIWSDASGLFTADPRKIREAKLIENISYEMCQEAADMGTQIIHPYSIKPCHEKKIPIYIKNTFRSDDIGTCVSSDVGKKSFLISYQGGVTVFKIKSLDMWGNYGFLDDMFHDFKEEKIDVDIVTTSRFSVTVTTTEKILAKLTKVADVLSKKYTIEVISRCSVVSIISDHIHKNKKIHEINSIISEMPEPVYTIHYGDNDMSLSYVVDEINSNKFMQILHNNLIK